MISGTAVFSDPFQDLSLRPSQLTPNSVTPDNQQSLNVFIEFIRGLCCSYNLIIYFFEKMDQYEGKYNTKSTSVKRLMREAKELQEATEDYSAHPLEENLFEWHFTIRGPPDSDFAGGVYHGRILLPAEYPMKPPNIILLTVCIVLVS